VNDRVDASYPIADKVAVSNGSDMVGEGARFSIETDDVM
jgi:hypothetical protein